MTLEDVFVSIERQIKRIDANIFVTANAVVDANKDYIFVNLKPSQKNVGFNRVDKMIMVDLAVVLCEPEIYASDLYNWLDDLAQVFSGYIKIKDRYISIYNISSNVIDKVAHFDFELNFSDIFDFVYDDEIVYGSFMEHLVVGRSVVASS